MPTSTSIEWTDATWSPMRGCSRISAGCENCYAETIAGRFSGKGQAFQTYAIRTKNGGRWTRRVNLITDQITTPLRWKKARRIFVNSMSDTFHELLSNEDIATVFALMAACPQHTFQVLTKRPDRARAWFEWLDERYREPGRHARYEIEEDERRRSVEANGFTSHPTRPATWHARLLYEIASGHAQHELDNAGRRWAERPWLPWPLRNVWMGTSTEDQPAANHRIPHLLRIPAAVRFLSVEPLIGAIDLTQIPEFGSRAPSSLESAIGTGLDRPAIDWVIAGAESGHGARPCEIAWLRGLRDQCALAGVAFFLKQAEVGRDYQAMKFGPGSEQKGAGARGGKMVGLPYLDGKQHSAMPAVR